jgi:8-oxo-dGTP pyrophosphatase MutT (NUDIX family)
MLQETPQETWKCEPSDIADIQQAGAICLRRSPKGALRILLVGSMRNGRWGLPKGHIEADETSPETALREAFEEAGVRGTVDIRPFGSFTYMKDSALRRYRVTAHVVDVRSIAKTFPEKTSRRTRWFGLDQAAAKAGQPGLRILLESLRSS